MPDITRRKFGQLAMGGAALAIAGSNPQPLRADSTMIGGVRIGVMSYSFRDRPLKEAIETAARLGFTTMEICGFCHLDAQKVRDDQLKSWRKTFHDAGMEVSAYYAGFGKDWTDQQIAREFQAAHLLGTGVITTSVRKEMVPRLDKAAQQAQIKVGLHNHSFTPPDPTQFATPEDFEWALSHFSEWININLDAGHLFASGYDPVKFFEARHARIVSLHIKDRGSDPRHLDHPFGQGATPIIPLLQACRKVRFQYPANIEWEVENSDPVRCVSDALAYLRSQLAM